jgi:photosystem II stability/assembly factor-like uncharacterized protein
MISISSTRNCVFPLPAMLLGLLTAQALLSQPLPSGSAAAVVVDPTNPNTLYAAAGVGVFKSTTGGQSWSNTGLPANSATVITLALDPSNPAVVYVAASDGVYVSSNGGQSWTYPAGNPGCSESLAVVPTTPTTIYAGACGWGIYKSTNGGQTFASASPDLASQAVISIAVDVATPSTLYAATNNGVYKSTTSGQSWTSSSSGLAGQVLALAIDATHPANVWAGNGSGLFESTNGGQSWSTVVAGLPTYGYVRTIVFDHFTHSTMYVGTNAGVYKSTNGGQTWAASNSGLPAGFIYGIAADPVNACVLYAATTFDTIFRTVNCGESWFAANSGVEGLEVYAVEVDPTNPSTLYVGTNGSGLWKSVNGGLDWSRLGVPGGTYIGSVTIDPSAPATIYAGGYKTTNGGQSWVSIGPYPTLAIDPSNSSVLYAAGYGANWGNVYKTTNGGQSWTAYSSGLPATSVQSLAVDPGNSSNVFEATWDSGVYRSNDGGQHWAAANSGFSQPYLESMSFDRNNPHSLYVGLTNGLFKSSNGAQSWSQVSGLSISFITALAFDPSNARTFYVGGFGGISKTTNGGQTWTAQNSGLDFLYVQSLKVDPSNPSTVYAGVFGGLYKSTNGGATWQKIGVASTTPTTIQPAQGTYTQSIPVALSGSTKLNGARVKLSYTGVPDIAATNTANPNPSVLTATFNLSGATPGPRDVVITAADNSVMTLYSAFTVIAGPACTYTVGPQSASFGVTGGTGQIIVSAPAQCGWNFSSDSSWITFPAPVPHNITVPPTVNPVLPYSVAPNSNTSKRTGTITVAGQNVVITQAGLSTCTYSLSPASLAFASSSSPAAVAVTAAAGCPWNAVSNVAWVTITPATASGTGNGSVSMVAAANSGNSRSGTLTIAGQTFNVSQAAASASACGAADVSGQITVTKGVFFACGSAGSLWCQTISLRNVSGHAISGPIYMIMDGLPKYDSGVCRYGCGLTSGAPITHCQSAGSFEYDFLDGTFGAGQVITRTLNFSPGPWTVGAGSPSQLFSYTTRMFSGTPNQ